MSRFLLAAAAAILSLCGASVHAQGLPEGNPAELGISAERLERLTRAMEHDAANGRRAGMVIAISRKGKMVYNQAFGFADIEAGEKMRTDHIFRLHSQTKPMISVGLLMLMEEGHFLLEDPLAVHIPEFAGLKLQDGLNADGTIKLKEPARQPTMHDVLRHTSGFPGGTLASFPDPVSQAAARRENWPEDMQGIVDELASMPLAYEPGSEWRYGAEHDLQAYLIEKFSGMPLEDFMRERIFEPLGMVDTFYRVPADKLDRYTAMYEGQGDGSFKILDPKRGGTYLAEADKAPRGGSGVSSTAADQLRFGQMLINGGELDGVRLLGRKTVEMMLTDQLPPEAIDVHFEPTDIRPGIRYGLGIGLYTDVAASGLIGSQGVAYWSGFAHTVTYIDPAEDMQIAIFTQHRPKDNPWLSRVRTLAYQALVD